MKNIKVQIFWLKNEIWKMFEKNDCKKKAIMYILLNFMKNDKMKIDEE